MFKIVSIASILLFGSFSLIAQSPMKVNSIEFKANYFKYKGTLVDVRTPEEYNAGHIEGARNINVAEPDNFEMIIDKFDRNQPIFVYCAVGVRSSRAAAILRKKGFKNVFDLDGGYPDLVKVGMKNSIK